MRAYNFALLTATILGISSLASSARADFLFNFNSDNSSAPSLTNGSDGNYGTSITNSDVAAYMNQVIQTTEPGATAHVHTVTGAVTQTSWTADNHVVGPQYSVGSDPNAPLEHNHVVPLTLGDTDGSVSPNIDQSDWHLNTLDQYLTNPGGEPSGDRITMQFSGLTITGVSFDLEIFPDISCSSVSSSPWTCGGASNPNIPDFTLLAGTVPGDATPQISAEYSAATIDGVIPNSGGTYCHSGVYHYSMCEPAPQLLTHVTYTFSADANISYLAFVDWPETIGIDNLSVGYPPPSVPEPATLSIFGFGLAGLGFMRRRRRKA